MQDTASRPGRSEDARADERRPLFVAVMPARSAPQIGSALAGIPPLVDHIVVVDDASPDDLAGGLPMLLFGVLWSAFHWYRSHATGVVASTGTVVIGALTILLGFQLLLQAVVLDVQNEPGRRPR